MATIVLRDVQEVDLSTFFLQQMDPDAVRMAAFPSRDRDVFMAHWSKSLTDATTVLKTIAFDGKVAGNIVCWEESGERNVGYWLGKPYWGQRIATAALSQFLGLVKARPLHAHVATHNLASIRVLQKCGFIICGEKTSCGIEGEPGTEFILRLDGSD